MELEKSVAKGLSIGIIMDGNGRWAKRNGLPRTAGHKKGAEVFKDIIRYCNELEIASVTFYAFSTENWARPMEEVNAIMKLFGQYLIMAYDYQKENNKVVFLGDRAPLPKKYQAQMADIEEKTKNNKEGILNICLNYGGQEEIIDGAIRLAQDIKNGLDVSEFKREDFYKYMYHELPPIDLLIRTGGEERVSNFMLYEMSYAEFYFTNTYFPDFDKSELNKALFMFDNRDRRFGGINDKKSN